MPIIRHPTYTFEPPADAFRLPGFVENGVTYESHTFFVEFEARQTRPGATIYVRHGGGWESLSVRHMAASALSVLIDRGHEREAFFLCWNLHELAYDERKAGRDETAQEYREAFVSGRLKKRKMPGRAACKVWIEPPPATAPPAAA